MIPYALPFRQPYVTSRGSLDRREMVLLRIRRESGEIGLGEAVPLSLRGGTALSEVTAQLERWGRHAVESGEIAFPGDFSAPARIAIPRLPESIKGTASFSNAIDSTLRCHAKNIPFNATVTVTNLDNSQSVQCVASVGGAAPEFDIVLATDTFARIADLTDAPVPVQLTWVTG